MEILQETNQFIAINKPPGIIVEKNPYESSVEDWVWDYLSIKNKKPYLGIIHRLDRVTSGVLLMAKKKSFLKNLNEQFRLRKIKKTYWAKVENKPPNSAADLVHFLEKDLKNKKANIFPSPKKKTSEVALHYRILSQDETSYLLEIHPKTGKFHQIRAQLAAIDCPIIGDEKYGGKKIKDGKSIALHAARLLFKNPITGEKTFIEAKSTPFLF